MKIKKVSITGRKENPEAKKAAREAIRILEEKGITVETDKAFLRKGKSISAFSGDIVLSFGGDGTLLSVFRELKKKIPVVGMGFGNVGYLQTFNELDVEASLEKILNGKIKIENRTRIQAKVDGKKVDLALNEVLIVPEKADRLLHLLAPILIVVPALLVFAVLPFGRGMTAVDLNVGVLFFFGSHFSFLLQASFISRAFRNISS